MSDVKLDSMLSQFNKLTHKPVNYLSVQKGEVQEDIKSLIKGIYDFTKSQERNKNKNKTTALTELIVEDFDEEQIWQQIELQNTERWDHFVWDVANSVSAKSSLLFPLKDPEEAVERDSEAEGDESETERDGSDALMSDEENETIERDLNEKVQGEKKKQKSKSKPSIVDDDFFKLKDMEKFLLQEEKESKNKDDSDEESIDLFEDIESSDSEDEEVGGKDMMYSDFFKNDDQDDIEDEKEDDKEQEIVKKPKDKKVTFADESSEQSDEEELSENLKYNHSSEEESDDSEVNKKTMKKKEEKQSEFEQRQQRLQQQISRLEDKTLSEAPWQLKGEVDATKRPQNSLLQEVVDFDLTTRPPPIITEQTTITLEDIIKRRIKDKAWDDVVKKEKPVENNFAFKKQEILDQAKSKQSLAEVYEAEYLKQKHSKDNDGEQDDEPESHKEIKEAMRNVFAKLDALSNYHYTPKAAQPEVKIVSNTPAISMEEVAPVVTSNAMLLAPEEVKRKKSGELMSKEERTTTDKKRERRKKKKHQSLKGGVKKVTDDRNTKKGVHSNDNSLKTSKAFFQQLNDNTTSVIKLNNNKRKNVKNKGQ